MSIVVAFDNDDWYILNETIHGNSSYTVNSKTTPCELNALDAFTAWTLSIILIVIFLLAIPGNVLVGWVLATSWRNLTSSDVYLFHLTVADGLIALTIPFWSVAVVRGWIFGDTMCKLINLVFEANFYTSILFLSCISVERYFGIVHANDNRGGYKKMCSWLLCAAVWAFGGALALPALFNDAIPLRDSQTMICTETFDIGSASLWRTANRGFRHIFGFLLPLLVMIFCYSITIQRLLSTRGFQKYRAMRVIIAVVITFLLCWTPYHLSLMIDTLLRAGLITYNCTMRTSVSQALVLTNTLALLHSCMNPVLYAFVGERFRGKMKMLFQRKIRQERASSSKFSRSTSQTSEGNGAVL